MKKLKNEERVMQVVSIVRGLLAEASGDDDDPYARVIVRYSAGKDVSGKCDAMQLKGIDVSASDDDARNRVRLELGRKRREGRIDLDGIGMLKVERESQDASYPLRNKVAVVTGAAGAIGAGICRGLLEKGCHVAAMDIVQERLDELVEELKSLGADRIIGLKADVTDKSSVASGFEQVVKTWGGVDIVVVNAGIAMVASLMDIDPAAFRKIEAVNVEGTLLTIAEAGRWMTRQGTGGDIVLVSSKNVFAPGAQFGAYSATKAASHQLARIASLEYAGLGIRVNMVSPDGVFGDGKHKSGLWAEVGPSRMKARGLDEKGLEEYYRNRNLLKARVTPAHVANAVMFFVTRQVPCTGMTIPVDGGVPEATPR